MKASRMTILVLSILLCFLIQTGKGLAAEEVNPSAAAKFRKNLHPSQRDKEVDGRKQPSLRLGKVAEGEAQLGDGAYNKTASNLQLGTSKQKPNGKRPFLPQSPPKSKSQGHEDHLEGHGNFNTDTYSCPGIQLKTCRKPSDCDGCLGLYTCKLPKGRCDFKAVSRQTDVSNLVMKCLQENTQAQRIPKDPRQDFHYLYHSTQPSLQDCVTEKH